MFSSIADLRITVATGNAHKLAELRASLAFIQPPPPILLESADALQDVDETGLSFLENARLKACATPPNVGSEWVLAEDTGLVIEALAGYQGLDPFPGVQSNRWLTPERRQSILGLDETLLITQAHRNEAILRLMSGLENRRAEFVTALVLYHPASGRWIETEGRWDLMLVASRVEAGGDGGFGYDPIVYPAQRLENPSGERLGEGLTVAQLPEGLKTQVSHRARAFAQALTQLSIGK